MKEPTKHDSELLEGPSAEAFDPVLEVFKRDIDFSIVERNLRLSTEERAQQWSTRPGSSTSFVR